MYYKQVKFFVFSNLCRTSEVTLPRWENVTINISLCVQDFVLIKSLATPVRWCNGMSGYGLHYYDILAGQWTLGKPCAGSSFCHICTDFYRFCARYLDCPLRVRELRILLSPLTRTCPRTDTAHMTIFR